MTETTTSTIQAPAPRSPLDDTLTTAPATEEGSRNRRTLLVLAGAAGALVLGAGYFLLGSHGGSSGSTPFTVVHHARHSLAAPLAAAPAPVPLPATFNGAVGRDPFADPFPAPPSPVPSAATATAPAPAATLPGTAAAPVQQQSATPTWVELDSQQGSSSATFRVAYTDGTTLVWQNVVAPPAGSKPTTFANDFALLSLRNGAASVQMGDGKPFTLLQGFANRHFLG